MITIHHADCVEWLQEYALRIAAGEAEPFDSCATDPPYHLTSIVKRFGKPGSAEAKVGATGAYARASRGFMGKEWDGGDVAFRPETWRAIYDCLKPGAHLAAFSGTRTYHRMACAIEDAGFEIRDCLYWHYGSGFPKSHNISKAIDKAAGAEREVIGDYAVTREFKGRELVGDPSHATRVNITAPATEEAKQWDGWGTALKPSTEPICLARKPLSESSVAANVLRHGTGAINVDGCRVDAGGESLGGGMVSKGRPKASEGWDRPWMHDPEVTERKKGESAEKVKHAEKLGRFPANLLHDGSPEVVAMFPETGPAKSGGTAGWQDEYVGGKYKAIERTGYDEPSGSAARFFYSAKAGPLDRIGTAHATVKPVDLMRWLARLITPPGGTVLEPFAGSGTTGIACMAEGFGCTMIEMDEGHVADIERKLAHLRGEGGVSIIEMHKARIEREEAKGEAPDLGPLFAGGVE